MASSNPSDPSGPLWNPPPLWQYAGPARDSPVNLDSAALREHEVQSGGEYVAWAAGVTRNMRPGPLLVYFFSTDNVNYLQSRTVAEVKRATSVDVGPQSTGALLSIMMNRYQYALSGMAATNNRPGFANGHVPIKETIKLLNKSVLEETVKQVLTGIKDRKFFLETADRVPQVLDLPVFTSMVKTKNGPIATQWTM